MQRDSDVHLLADPTRSSLFKRGSRGGIVDFLAPFFTSQHLMVGHFGTLLLAYLSVRFTVAIPFATLILGVFSSVLY